MYHYFYIYAVITEKEKQYKKLSPNLAIFTD